MINKFLTLIFVFTTLFSFSQNMEPLYFDANWKTTTKENASFYRIQPSKKLGNLILVEDFYINKTPQFQGYSFQDNEDNYVGDVLWLDENGFDSSFYQFYNFSAVSNLTYYYPSGKKLKTIQYKNGRKDGETILYHEDGSVLMKGKYDGGKPASGDFEEVLNWEDYRLNKADNAADREEPIRMTEGMIIRDETDKTKSRKIIKKKIFWTASKQLAQEIWYDIANGNTEPFKQINYDKSGKILQTINENDFEKYGREISNGVVYNYYFQNKFAVALKSKTNYKNGQKNGEEIQYFPNGKVLKIVKYSDGEEQGDQVEYNSDGSIKAKRIYKNGQPFEGNFDERFASDLFINQNYNNGLIEGEAIVKDESGNIVAKGIYKDGKPFSGTFVVKTENEQNELISVSGYKKNGIQKIFNYYLDDPVRTYTVVNDIKNGETVFYDNREVTGKLEYKNDLPYEGTLVEAQKSTIYKKGAVTEEIYYRSEYDKKGENNILKTIYFENGKRTKIVNQSFLITSDRQDSYVGIYKNDKPYSGYFATDFNEFNYVDYYENGVIKYQYSNNYLENLEKYQYPNYDIKSTYKDGKIVDGPEYIKLERQFITKYWKNNILQSFDFDIFAMHYFNRYHFELKNNAIELEEFNKKVKGKIALEKVNNKTIGKFSVNDKVLLTSSELEVNETAPSETGSVLYYETENKIEAKLFKTIKGNDEQRRDSEIFSTVFTSYLDHNKSIQENFNSIAAKISSEKDVELLFGNELKGRMIGGLRINEAKKPEIGTLILKNKNNLYDLKLFLDEKILEEKKNIDFKNIKTEVENLNKTLEKKMNEDFK
ncbi:Antitoxin component YwqK of the YwqJK toxin-antitoxin module [Flavobacterium johnsoniae]|uniref:Antitoxin component YwqK of the YwqJK toxin-antitoxin module n=2 Tax=Flavobacterium johnsoniae TaxID=986 RepID=A0A1M5RYM3_FLAJO|nr:Antitoxin component YwqK of the YwqJK toxin-antitoxin module [Flavobacterium johnsoniae]